MRDSDRSLVMCATRSSQTWTLRLAKVMNCEYWKDVVQHLRNPERCNWASHVLSSGLTRNSNPQISNLAEALKCVSPVEVIEGTVHAYRDWTAQPYCDLILSQFKAEEVLSVYLEIQAADSNMKVGVLGILEDLDRKLAERLALSLNQAEEPEKVVNAVRDILRAY